MVGASDADEWVPTEKDAQVTLAKKKTLILSLIFKTNK